MPRAFIPTEYHRIETRRGAISIAPTSADHIYATTTAGREYGTWTINGVPLRVDAHLYRWRDGSWQIGAEDAKWSDRLNSLYLNRRDNGDHASAAARRKVEALLQPLVTAWAEDHPDVLAAAVHADRNNRARNIEAQIENLEAALSTAREQLAAIEAEA